MNKIRQIFFFLLATFLVSSYVSATIKIGLNIPLTGPYSAQGLDQKRAYEMVRDEINESGGINGEKIEYIITDSKSNAKLSEENAKSLIKQGVKLITGGSSSGVAVAVGKICQKYKVPFLATLTYSNTTTALGLKYLFRETYNAHQAAKSMAELLNSKYKGKKYFYITADYTWGWTTRDSVMKFTNTTGAKDVLVPLGTKNFEKQLLLARLSRADVLVLVLFGGDMVTAIRQATNMGLKDKMQIVVPNQELNMANGAGPKINAGVIGAVPWCWQVPFKYNYPEGKKFVNKYKELYNRYPGSGAATAYVNIKIFKDVVESVKSTNSKKIVKKLEGYKFTGVEGKQYFRDWDHQGISDVFVVAGKQPNEMENKWDYFDIISRTSGENAAQTRKENPVKMQSF